MNNKWNLSRFCSTILAGLTMLTLSVVTPESVTHADPKVKSDNNGSINHHVSGLLLIDPATDQPLTASSSSNISATAQPGCAMLYGTGPDNLVNVVVPKVEEDVFLRLVLPSTVPSGEVAKFRVTSADSSIVKARSAVSSEEDPIVEVQGGQRFSNTFRVLGNKIGSTQIKATPYDVYTSLRYAVWIGSAGAWDFNGLLDYNALGDTSKVCYDAGAPTLPSGSLAVSTTCGGRKAEAVSTDGSSRILLRTESGLKGKACFKVISDPDPKPGVIKLEGGTDGGDSAYTQIYNQKHWGFGTYMPPTNFAENSLSLHQSSKREVEVEIAFTPENPALAGNYDYTLTTKTKKKITLKRPPVILVHGIWSSSEIWRPFFRHPDPEDGWKIEALDYPNSQHFASSAIELQNKIKSTVGKSRELDVATTKADVIAHSMGGLVSRAFINSLGGTKYLRDDNFNEGDIHKLITLDTPHEGSQLANLLVSLHDSNTIPHTKIAGLEEQLAAPNGNLHDGAVCDLAENSQGIGLGSISGNIMARAYNSTGGAYSSSGSLTSPLGLLTRMITDDYLFNSYIGYYGFRVPNDATVTQASQNHGLPGPPTFPTLVHSNIPFNYHTAVTADPVVAANTYVDLDMNGLSDTGFVSAIGETASNGTGVPTSAGIGDGSDANHYNRQCSLGGPMNVYPNIGGTIAAVTMAVIVQAATIVPGVTITAPIDGAVVRPGDTITVRVNVDSSLNPSSVLIYTPGAPVGPIEITTPPYETTLTIPTDWAGPLKLGVNVKTTNGDIVGPSSVFINVVPQEAPTRIEFINKSEVIKADPTVPPELRTLRLRGNYANNIERNISHPSLGTTYTSSNPAVVTVSPEGILVPVAQGRAFITASFRGLKAYTRVTVGDQMAVAAIPVDHTSEATITGGGFLLDRATGQFVQQVTLKNNSVIPFSRPLSFVLAGLPSGVQLVDKKDVTQNVAPLGSPYADVSYAPGATFSGEYLLPGESATFQLRVFNFNNQPITYTPKLYSGRGL